MAGGVEEGDPLAVLQAHLVGADVLGDAAVLAGRHVGGAQGVQQLVLPWSTWPMTVTTGGRGTRWSSTSSAPMKPSSTSASDTRRTVWPNSVATSSAVSLSITSLIFSITP